MYYCLRGGEGEAGQRNEGRKEGGKDGGKDRSGGGRGKRREFPCALIAVGWMGDTFREGI